MCTHEQRKLTAPQVCERFILIDQRLPSICKLGQDRVPRAGTKALAYFTQVREPEIRDQDGA